MPNHGVQPHWLSDGEGGVGVESPPINKSQFQKKFQKKFLEKIYPLYKIFLYLFAYVNFFYLLCTGI